MLRWQWTEHIFYQAIGNLEENPVTPGTASLKQRVRQYRVKSLMVTGRHELGVCYRRRQ